MKQNIWDIAGDLAEKYDRIGSGDPDYTGIPNQIVDMFERFRTKEMNTGPLDLDLREVDY